MPQGGAKILLVDDEPSILEGLARNLGLSFRISTASSGHEGLAKLESAGPFPVVVSDMRMPAVSGAEFLAQVRKRWPETVRMLLTGHADVPAAVAAVNSGGVFRFLTKPCARQTLVKALEDGLRQYDLVTTERVLLDQTLRGSLALVADVVDLVQPEAMGPVLKVRRVVRELARAVPLDNAWAIEMAAMFAQLSSLTLPEEVVTRRRLGKLDGPEDKAMVRRCNLVAQRLVAQVPRLEPVRDLLREAGHLEHATDPQVSHDAAVLRIALDYTGLLASGVSPRVALAALARKGDYAAPIVAALRALNDRQKLSSERRVMVDDLKPGMVLLEPLVTQGGVVVAPAEADVTAPLLERLAQFATQQALREPVLVRAAPGATNARGAS